MREKSGLKENPLAHVIARLRAAEVLPEPYPHYYLENVFPEDYYRAMLKHLPGNAVYQNLFDVTDYKLDHFRHRDQRDLREGWTEELPDEIKGFWDSFSEWFLGPDLAEAVLDSFREPLSAQYGEKNSWPEVANEPQLIRHRAG